MRFDSTASTFKKLTLSEFTFFQFLLALNSIIFHWLYPKITVESCFGYIQMIFVHIFLCRLMSWLAFFGYRKRGFTKSYALFFIRKFWYHFFFCCLKLLFWHFLSVFREENSSSRNSMAKIYTHIVIFFCWILFLIQELEKSSFLTNYT